MSEVNLEEAARSCRWISSGDHNFRLIDQGTGGRQRPTLNLRGDLKDKKFAEKLRDRNKDGYGVFFTFNKTDGQGVKASNIIRNRGVWADLDDGLPADGFPLQPVIAHPV